MAYMITEECSNCGACESICPGGGISRGADTFVIDPARCTECVGHFDEPQCQQVCPVDCIPLDPNHIETEEQLLAKYHKLTD